MDGYLREIFTSIQGEGIYVGRRQTFIRFSGCNLSCNYCDTPDAQRREVSFRHEHSIYSNPVTVQQIMPMIKDKDVSITGGEPLLQIDFLEELLAELKKKHLHTYLETNGTLPEMMARIVDYIDCFSIDFKIPSATGGPHRWTEHEDCLSLVKKRDVFIKIVINENVLPAEIDTACRIIGRVDTDVPLVIQPVFGAVINNLPDIQRHALQILPDVRVIPQVHKYINVP